MRPSPLVKILAIFVSAAFVLGQPPAAAGPKVSGRTLRGPQSEKVRAGLEEQLTQAGIEERLIDLERLRSTASWREIFGNDRPVVWEVGFAPGWVLKEQAVNMPTVNFLGIESSWRGMEDFDPEAFPPNVRFVMEDIRKVLEVLPPSLRRVHGIQVGFPPSDREPERHSYLFHPDGSFPGALIRLIEPGGWLDLWTESEEVADLSLEAIQTQGLQPTGRKEIIPPTSPKYPNTPSGRRYKEEGRPAFHVWYRTRAWWPSSGPPQVISLTRGLSAELQQFVRQLVRNWIPEGGVWSPGQWSTVLMLEAMEGLRPIFRDAEVLDTGTGSGPLILAALHHLGARHGTATDIDEVALEQTRLNAESLGISGERLELVPGDLLEPVRGRRFDVALFNPPSTRLAKLYLREIGELLPERGVALLLWNTDVEAELAFVAEEAGLSFAPILEMGDPSEAAWTVYAVTLTPDRLTQVASLLLDLTQQAAGQPAPPGAGMEEAERTEIRWRVLDALRKVIEGRELHWQVAGPSVAKRYPGVIGLDHYLIHFSVDLGGSATGLVVELLASQRPKISAVTYYGTVEEHVHFSALAKPRGIRAGDRPIPAEAPSFQDFLQRILANLVDLEEREFLELVREKQVNLQQLAADLERLGAA